MKVSINNVTHGKDRVKGKGAVSYFYYMEIIHSRNFVEGLIW